MERLQFRASSRPVEGKMAGGAGQPSAPTSHRTKFESFLGVQEIARDVGQTEFVEESGPRSGIEIPDPIVVVTNRVGAHAPSRKVEV